MEIISVLALGVSPFVVKWIVGLVKKLRTVTDWSNPVRVTALRSAVAVLSFLAVIGTSLLSGNEVDVSIIEKLVNTLLVGIGATGLYFWEQRKK